MMMKPSTGTATPSTELAEQAEEAEITPPSRNHAVAGVEAAQSTLRVMIVSTRLTPDVKAWMANASTQNPRVGAPACVQR